MSFSAFVRDITQRKTTEERLKEQANLLDRAQDAIIVGDTEDRIQYWNRGAERIYGWKAAEALGKSAAQLLFRQSAPEPEEANRAVLNQGDWVGEFQQVTKDGRDIIVESRWSLLRDPGGKPRGKLVINTDVTQRKKLESQFLRAQRLESIGTLAGGIAHDLNNVLTPVMMAGKLLQKPDRPEAERKHLFETLQASAERGAEMVRQLLVFAGGMELGDLQRSSLNLRHVVREVRSILEHTFIKSICIETHVPGDIWLFSGDATQMSQVLMNLCVNARDAMPQGGTLSIAAANTIVHDAALHPDARPGPYVLVTVADTGHGIPPDVIDKVFDPFFTTKEQGKGTGLGLSTVLGIVRSHGGFINVYSEVGKGTKLSIYLPAIDTALVEIRNPKSEIRNDPEPAPGNGELILVVDDEAFIRATARAALEAGGYRVVTAADGKEGIETFRRDWATNGAIRAVLLDVMMPGMDGPTTMRHLRELDPKVRIVAASGLRATGEAAVAIASGTRGFLQKPFTDAQLLRAVNRALNDDM